MALLLLNTGEELPYMTRAQEQKTLLINRHKILHNVPPCWDWCDGDMWSSGQARVSPGLAPAVDSCWPFISESEHHKKMAAKTHKLHSALLCCPPAQHSQHSHKSQPDAGRYPDILVSWYLGRYGRNLEQEIDHQHHQPPMFNPLM